MSVPRRAPRNVEQLRIRTAFDTVSPDPMPPALLLGRTDAMREQLLDQARAAGRMGARRVGDAVLFGAGVDPTATFIGLALDAFEQGRAERQR